MRRFGKPPPNVGVSTTRSPTQSGGWSQSPQQGFQDAVVSAGSLKPAVVNAAFALIERIVQYDDGSVDTVFELRILDNLPGSRIVTCVLAESATEKCTIDNESWFADPFELVHYHQRVPYCIDHAPASGRRTMYFLRAVETTPDDVLGQARVAAQAALFPVNLRFLGSIVFYIQVRARTCSCVPPPYLSCDMLTYPPVALSLHMESADSRGGVTLAFIMCAPHSARSCTSC